VKLNGYTKDGQPVPHALYVAHWMLRSGALHPFDDQKVSHSYSLIFVILFFLHVLSNEENLAFSREKF